MYNKCINTDFFRATSFATLAKKAGIERSVSAMIFRHTFATHMFEAEVAIDEIKEMLGHDIDTETCIYIHVTLDTARKLLNAHKANPFFKGYIR